MSSSPAYGAHHHPLDGRRDAGADAGEYSSPGRGEWVEEERRALLFEGREKATIVVPGAMTGHPIIKHVKILGAKIRGRPAGGSSPWWLWIDFVNADKQKRFYIERDFPTETVLVAWGWYAIDLSGLPSDDVNMHHHARDVAMWEEVSRRFHAVAKHTVWLDTMQAACVDWRRRHPESSKH
jgi:hypothetical protein